MQCGGLGWARPSAQNVSCGASFAVVARLRAPVDELEDRGAPKAVVARNAGKPGVKQAQATAVLGLV